ncbi:hypothetical protein ACWBC2_16595 [Salegentibacter agarivorans]
MAECIQCGSYTKFNGGLCYGCYKSDDSNEVAVLEEEPQETKTGLSDKDRNYRYNMIKGRIAETLIQELFLSLNYNVFRYGMECKARSIHEKAF